MSQFVIKQMRESGAEYWTGDDYEEDVNDAQYFNSYEDAEEELTGMEREDRHNTVIVRVDE